LLYLLSLEVQTFKFVENYTEFQLQAATKLTALASSKS